LQNPGQAVAVDGHVDASRQTRDGDGACPRGEKVAGGVSAHEVAPDSEDAISLDTLVGVTRLADGRRAAGSVGQAGQALLLGPALQARSPWG
jgi:hypothetical protein